MPGHDVDEPGGGGAGLRAAAAPAPFQPCRYCTPTGQFDAGPQPVTLSPGERAVAGVVWRNLTTGELDRLVNAPYMSVAPAAGDTLEDVGLSGGIDLGTIGRLGVSAWASQQTSSCP